MRELERTVDESSLVDAVIAWCAADFASEVRASGISEIVESAASVDAVRTIYRRRRRRLSPTSPLIAQTDGILDALDQLQGDDFLMVRLGTQRGAKGIVMSSLSGVPVYAFPLKR
jgi:hypothetical protein